MTATIGIVGKGNIGSELHAKASSKGWNVKWMMGSQGFFQDPAGKQKIGEAKDYDSKVVGLDAVFLAIPTLDDGEMALWYIKSALNAGVPVITCEKGALSNYYAELEGAVRSHRIGYSATAGGGSGLLGYLQERMGPGVRGIYTVNNGTLNYILEGLSRGRNLDEVVGETKILGYAEPGAKHPLEVFNKEGAGDVPMKTSIQFNLSNVTKDKMRARDVKVQMIGPDQLERLVKEAASRRYVVSITLDANDEEDVIWGFKHRIENWHISGGFRRIEDNPLLRELVPSGVNNAILVSEGGSGRHDPPLWGPGAGAGPTAGAMIIDAERILGR